MGIMLRRSTRKSSLCRWCLLLVMILALALIIYMYLSSVNPQRTLQRPGVVHLESDNEEIEVPIAMVPVRVWNEEHAPVVTTQKVHIETDRPKAVDVHVAPPQFEVLLKNSVLHGFRLDKVFQAAFRDLALVPDTNDYQLNVRASMKLPTARHLPQGVVPEPCGARLTTQKTVSIVIPFHREHWSSLLNTLYSIYSWTSMDLIEEIVLVDDFNQISVLQEPLRKHLARMPKVQLLRTMKREGLIRARMIGSRAARGDILVFLDAHVEVFENWLPPLIKVIARNDRTIAMPLVSSMHPNTLELRHTPVAIGSFDWELNYVWLLLSEEQTARQKAGKSIPTATMSGCAFAVDTEFWFDLGGYDEGMDEWGGENLELSFRASMCGGRLRYVSCSRVAHLFRKHLPYQVHEDALNINLQRVAEVWMDKYKLYYFFTSNKSLRMSESQKQSLRQRYDLRESLQCQNFSWYLQNIATSVKVPDMSSIMFGNFKNLAYRECISVNDTSQFLTMGDCRAGYENHRFYYSMWHRIQHNSTHCITFPRASSLSKGQLAMCSPTDSSQKWIFNPVVSGKFRQTLVGVDTKKSAGRFMMIHGSFKKCLQAIIYKHESIIILQPCDHKKFSQFWVISHEIHHNVKIVNNLNPT